MFESREHANLSVKEQLKMNATRFYKSHQIFQKSPHSKALYQDGDATLDIRS